MVDSDHSGSHEGTEGGRALRLRQPVDYREENFKTETLGFEDRPAKRQRIQPNEHILVVGEQLGAAALANDRDLQLESETAWALGFNALALTEEEENLLPSTADESCYTQVVHGTSCRWSTALLCGSFTSMCAADAKYDLGKVAQRCYQVLYHTTSLPSNISLAHPGHHCSHAVCFKKLPYLPARSPCQAAASSRYCTDSAAKFLGLVDKEVGCSIVFGCT